MQSCKWDAKNLHSDFEATTKDWPIKKKMETSRKMVTKLFSRGCRFALKKLVNLYYVIFKLFQKCAQLNLTGPWENFTKLWKHLFLLPS